MKGAAGTSLTCLDIHSMESSYLGSQGSIQMWQKRTPTQKKKLKRGCRKEVSSVLARKDKKSSTLALLCSSQLIFA